ncbi:hypothetical protein MSG28_008581 [Choristoneura fumiferana]|uniref:Uncharacterized protein n=1 Tax=Choristoneura fumiferana TaxID=7141 RepID=A0ACC0J7A4_CHOFU|nr:hypothetical protein MSG28_008581 [Choristoneura fumiferana]
MLNKFLIPQHFKMEDLRTATQLISKDSYMATIDLKDAYFLVPNPSSFVAKPYPGVREVIREAFLKKSLQDSTIDIMIKSLSNSTLQQYNTAYKHGLYPNESLSILALTKKLVTLLALSTGHRVQTLSVIKANNITINDMGAIIIVDGIIKTSGPNRNNPKLVLPHFVEKNTICPVKTLSSYITRMEQFRAFPNTEKLILTTTQPHHNASAQSISRWIKIVLRDSGVDVSVFTAHSTRHAATSAAYRAGVSIDLIKRTAGWTNSSKCFAKFYNLPLNNDKNDRAFAEAVFKS